MKSPTVYVLHHSSAVRLNGAALKSNPVTMYWLELVWMGRVDLQRVIGCEAVIDRRGSTGFVIISA